MANKEAQGRRANGLQHPVPYCKLSGLLAKAWLQLEQS